MILVKPMKKKTKILISKIIIIAVVLAMLIPTLLSILM